MLEVLQLYKGGAVHCGGAVRSGAVFLYDYVQRSCSSLYRL